MENRQQQILSEIKSMMVSIRSQLEMLDTKMAELQQIVDPEDFASDSVDIDIDVAEPAEEPSVEVVTVQEIPLEEPAEESVEEPLEEPVEAAAEESAEETLPEDMPAEEDALEEDLPEAAETVEEDLPESIFGEPEVVTIAARAEEKAKMTINDMMADDCAWRHDMPGAPVKDIRSAISLNDRVIFINLLFDEDAQSFVNALTRINLMETLDQVVEYVMAEFPSWDMNSDLVYRFMMAVRRKVQ